jgi:type VI secretion system protein VasJ
MNIDTLGKSPIPGSAPAGVDIRDTEQFALLQSEYAKLTNPAATEPPNTAIIIANAVELLTNQGKDLMVAAYLSNALMQQNGLTGLNQGLHILGDMIETYWESLYPGLNRLRGRRNSIQWLIDQTNKYLEVTTHEPQPAALISDSKAQVKRIDELLSSRDDESPPLFSINRYLDAVPIIQEVVTPIASGENNNSGQSQSGNTLTGNNSSIQSSSILPATNNAPSLAETQAVVTGTDALRALSLCNKNMAEIANVLLSEDMSNPLAYRLARQSAWNQVEDLPSHTNQQTLIPPPMPQVRDMISNAISSQSWENLIQICENNISASIFWLDLHYSSDQALAKLGAKYEKARAEVSNEVRRFLNLLPGLHLLTFNDGTPFANPATKQWLSELTEKGSSKSAVKLQGDDANNDNLQAAFDVASQFVREGFLGKALETVDHVINNTASAKLRLKARIRLCALVLEQQPVVDAKPFARPIIATLRHHDLATWEPEIAVDALKVAYAAFAKDNTEAALATELVNQLATLSAANAYEVTMI